MADLEVIQSRLYNSLFAVGDIVRRRGRDHERCRVESLSVSKGQLTGLYLINVKKDNTPDRRFEYGFTSGVHGWELEFRPEITLENRVIHSLFWDLQTAKSFDPSLEDWYAAGWHFYRLLILNREEKK